MKKIKAISFDGDGTLWDFDSVMRQSLHHVLWEMEKLDREAAARLDVDKMIDIRNKVALELKGKVTNLEVIRREAFRRTLLDIGKANDDLAEYLNAIYLKHRFEDTKPYDDVLPILRELGIIYSLGLLSNGNSYPERTGLSGIFKFAVFSQDYGIEKPDPEIFQIALNKARCPSQELIHVGDSLVNDIGGAKGVGVKCVWLNRKEITNSTYISPDFEIKSLKELPDILHSCA
jgi:FMN hydrolase / 5-amino-6-(5-phospho-D-ribitylamino)uracil phosphatase